MSSYDAFMRDHHISNPYGYMNPMIIEERKLNAVPMDVFSALMRSRIIFLHDAIDNEVAAIIKAQLLYLEAEDPKAPISLYIDSPGGYVSAGLGIYDTMQLVSPVVKTVCAGCAASMATVLLAAGAPGERKALEHSRIMQHQPSGGAYGTSRDIEIEAAELVKCRETLYEILAKHTGKTMEEITRDCDRDYWMSAEEAKTYGIIDKVL